MVSVCRFLGISIENLLVQSVFLTVQKITIPFSHGQSKPLMGQIGLPPSSFLPSPLYPHTPRLTISEYRVVFLESRMKLIIIL